MRGAQIEDQAYIDFVASMADHSPPSIIFLTGGEPLLRPRLIRHLAGDVHAFDSHIVALTGAFFLRRNTHIPAEIDEVIGVLDHLMISMDEFHEEEVPRRNLLAILPVLASRLDVSLQITGRDKQDSYLHGLIQDVRKATDDRVPMFVGLVSATGRGAGVRGAQYGLPGGGRANWPCHQMSWPVFTWNGHVTACCDQRVVSGPTPDHLSLHRGGRPANWTQVRQQLEQRPVLRAIRTYGPGWVHEKFAPVPDSADYCSTCRALPDVIEGDSSNGVEEWTGRSSFRAIETEVERLKLASRPHLLPEFADLSSLKGTSP